MTTLFPTLQQIARRGSSLQVERERCDLCREPVPAEHRHLLEVSTREICCTCRACGILFQRQEASLGKYRLIPDRRLDVEDFLLDELQWQRLRIPVGISFFAFSTPAHGPVAYCPGPFGAADSLPDPVVWRELEVRNPVLETMAWDVEALLVNRARGARLHYVVPIDDCYRLVALIRTHWKGLGGGQEVWKQIPVFFDGLARVARKCSRDERPF